MAAHSSNAAHFTLGMSQESADILSYEQGTFGGQMSDAVICVLDQVGETFHVLKAPHARILKLIEAGKIDAITPFVRTDERDQFAVFAGPLWAVTMRIVYNNFVEDIQSQSFHTFTKNQGYVVKRGTHIQSLIPMIMGVPQEDIEYYKHEVLTWADALHMVNMKRAAITIVPESIIVTSDPGTLTGLNTSNSLTLNGSFYVAKHRLALQGKFQQAIKGCLSTQAS